MSNKWFSRKWLISLFGEIVGGVTAIGGALYANEEIIYSGLGICVISLLGYLKAEKDVDTAREGSPCIHLCDHDKED